MKILTSEEAAMVLRTNKAFVLKKVESGEIPAYREGMNWKIPDTLLNTYIENRAISESKERKRIYEEKV